MTTPSPTGARPWLPMAVAMGVGLATTVVVLPARLLPAAFRAPELHVALETGNVLVGLLVALLVHGRFRSARRLHQLLLVDALLALAVANVALALAAGLDESATVDALRWASVGARLAGSALLCAAAVVPRWTRIGPRTARAGQAGLVVAGVVGGLALFGRRWPEPVEHGVTSLSTLRAPDAHPAVVLAQVAGLVLLATASAVLTRRALADGDRLTRWLAVGTILATFARVHYLVYPSLLSDVVYTGDALRAGFYACLLVGALQEIEGYWRLRTRAAVLDERRRMARDLHDGMAQELAFILVQARSLAAGRGSDGGGLTRIEDSATRALDEARRAIEALDRPDRRPLADELRGIAADLAGRHEVEIALDGVDTLTDDPPPTTTEQLLRIVGEAVVNAVRHGRARRIRISLAPPAAARGAHRLSVSDDGGGFVEGAPRGHRSGGYGLTSMHERAAAIGGSLDVDSEPGRGTTVTVSW